MRFLLLWGPVVLFMALIFAVSAVPDLGPLPGDVSDKSGHLAAYALLAVLILRALAGGRMAGVTVRRGAVAVLIATAYGVSDEVHQHFVPGRTAEGWDLLADAAGACAGVAVVLLIRRIHDATGRRQRYS